MPTLVNCTQPQENCSEMIRQITGQKATHNEPKTELPREPTCSDIHVLQCGFSSGAGEGMSGYVGVRTGLSCVTSHTPTRA